MAIQKKQIVDFPDEIILKICENLSAVDLNSFSKTSKRFTFVFKDSLRSCEKTHGSIQNFFSRAELLGKVTLISLGLLEKSDDFIAKISVQKLIKISSELIFSCQTFPFHLDHHFPEHYMALTARVIEFKDEEVFEAFISNPSFKQLSSDHFLRLVLKSINEKNLLSCQKLCQTSFASDINRDDLLILLCKAVEKNASSLTCELMKCPAFQHVTLDQLKSVFSALIMQGHTASFKQIFFNDHVRDLFQNDLLVIFKFCVLFGRKEMLTYMFEDPYFLAHCPDALELVFIQSVRANFEDFFDLLFCENRLKQLTSRQLGKILIEVALHSNTKALLQLLNPRFNCHFDKSYFASCIVLVSERFTDEILLAIMTHPTFQQMDLHVLLPLINHLNRSPHGKLLKICLKTVLSFPQINLVILLKNLDSMSAFTALQLISDEPEALGCNPLAIKEFVLYLEAKKEKKLASQFSLALKKYKRL